MSKGLNFDKIKDKLGKPVSSEEALKDIIPIDWNENITEEKQRVIILKLDK